MRWRSAVVAVFLVGLCPLAARAANTITWTTGFPNSTVAMKIAGDGKYTVDAGVSIDSIVMYANPVLGGAGGQVTCSINTGMKSWCGTITGLTSGAKYNVFARMTITNGGVMMFIDTTSVIVTVR